MSNPRLKLDFGSLNDSALETKAYSIYNALLDNAAFPNPTPKMEDVKASADDYREALAIAKTGSLYDRVLKNQKKAALVALLQNLGSYVSYTAKNDEAVLSSSGFDYSSGRNPAPAVTPATGQVLASGANSGELKYGFNKVPGAKSYIYQCTPDPMTEDSVWKAQMGTTCKTVFSGLESGKKYWVRVIAIGTAGQAVYSEPVCRFVI